MSCNCNNADPNCEPCAFCTPPGVRCLPDCDSEDPCPEKIDLCCVRNSGPDYPCSDIATGDPLCDLLLQFLEIKKSTIAFFSLCSKTLGVKKYL